VVCEMETGRTEFVGDWVSKYVAIRHRKITYTHKMVVFVKGAKACCGTDGNLFEKNKRNYDLGSVLVATY
jgi:hypothetical protein